MRCSSSPTLLPKTCTFFELPSLALLGTLTGFNGPQGECSDKLGHVWVTNTYSYQILEFAHDGSLVNTLTDPSGLPVSCAWDKKTGNLAVTNIYDFGGSQPPGEVLVYPGASGTPTAYTDADMYYYYSDGYDSHGNLFIDGTGGYPNYSFVFAELSSGNGSAHTIPIKRGHDLLSRGRAVVRRGALHQRWRPGLQR
jgi:hypothetical protein